MKLVRVQITKRVVQDLSQVTKLVFGAEPQAPWYQKVIATFVFPESEMREELCSRLQGLFDRSERDLTVSLVEEIDIDPKYIAEEYRA
jgi:hypothetical protein